MWSPKNISCSCSFAVTIMHLCFGVPTLWFRLYTYIESTTKLGLSTPDNPAFIKPEPCGGLRCDAYVV